MPTREVMPTPDDPEDLPAEDPRPDGPAPEEETAVRAGHHIMLAAEAGRSPLWQVARRLSVATLVLVATALIVYADSGGYHDNANGQVDLLDAFYYATVTLSTTGYGDIVPYSDSARLVNILVVTPLRVLFLIILVGTTLEVLTERTRRQLHIRRWRSRMREHTVVVGYGTKGRNAVHTLIGQGAARDTIVVVDPRHQAVETANNDGLVGVLGDGTRSETLLRAEIRHAAQVVITTQRDDTAVLTTLTARQLNPRAVIVVAVREDEHVPLLRQSGASTVVTSSSSAGRLLGMAVVSPYVGAVLGGVLPIMAGSRRPARTSAALPNRPDSTLSGRSGALRLHAPGVAP